MTTKQLIGTMALLAITLASCKEDNASIEQGFDGINKVSFALGIPTSTTGAPENEVKTIDIYSFRKKNQESEYTMEKVYQDIIPTTDESNQSIQIELDGSLERILYVVANSSMKIPLISELPIQMFEEVMKLRDNKVPQLPYTMTTKQSIPAILPDEPIAIKLEHTLACLDINNQYTGFRIDSLIVKDAVCGSVLFNPNTPTTEKVQRADINYGNRTQIYLYQTDASTLAVYGKYNGIRTVFDIQLKNIKRATRYRVTFRGINDSAVDFASNLAWNVTEWNSGATVETSPNWR